MPIYIHTAGSFRVSDGATDDETEEANGRFIDNCSVFDKTCD